MVGEWYETGSRTRRNPLIGAVLEPRRPVSTDDQIWTALDCGCEQEVDKQRGLVILHYTPFCWRHAPVPPYIIEEEP